MTAQPKFDSVPLDESVLAKFGAANIYLPSLLQAMQNRDFRTAVSVEMANRGRSVAEPEHAELVALFGKHGQSLTAIRSAPNDVAAIIKGLVRFNLALR